MSVRLINAETLKKFFDPDTWQGELMIATIAVQHTAFDHKAILGRLEDLRKTATIVDSCPENKAYCRQSETCNECFVKAAIEIVKEGLKYD